MQSGMITPMRSSLGCGVQISQQPSCISTPKLTPLKNIERKRGENLVSKIDIGALEEKIKAIETQIDQVKMIGGKRKLDLLEQSLNNTLI